MKIFVCVKHVPDTAARIIIRGAASYDTDVKFVMNPHDEYAVEQALALKRAYDGTEITAVSLGGEDAEKTLRSALALGVDRAVLLTTEIPLPGPRLTAAGLAAAIGMESSPDLVFMGSRSIDVEAMQTHYRLAAALDLPIATEISGFSMTDGKIRLEREIGSGAIEQIEITIPCLIGTARGLNLPRPPTLPAIMRARKKVVERIPLASLVDTSLGEGVKTVRLMNVVDERRATMASGSTKEIAADLARIVKAAIGHDR
jgi:electron transfer flavoprotein beta subunit